MHGATACYTYDAEGRRVRRSVPGDGITDDYLYDLSGNFITQMSGSGTWVRGEIYAGGTHIATYENDLTTPTTFFKHADHLGTERVETGVSGASCETTTSLPFGDGLNTSGSCDPTQLRFTGKQRDFETNLDNFGIRFSSSSLGRFTSPDSIANDWELANPQTWNRYAYARNNPLIYVDPDGAAVELIGATDEERKKALAELQRDVGNKDAASRLYINEVKDGDHTRYFVGIKGDVGDFMKSSDTAHDLANLVQDKQVVEFGLTNEDLSARGGAVTYEKGEVGNQNVRVLVNPNEMDIADRNLNPNTILGALRWAGQNQDPRWSVQPFTPGIAEWHEFGHSWGYIHGRVGGASNSEALQWENRMREQVYGPLGPDNAPRITH